MRSPTGKRVLLTLAALFLLWQSVKLTPQLPQFAGVDWPWRILLAWVYNLFVTGVFAFAGFAYPTQRLLPPAYYRIHRPARLDWWYRRLGVAYFRSALLATLWRGKEQSARYFNGRRDGVAQLREQSEKSEFGHLIPLVILTGVSSWLVASGATWLALATQVINVIGNLYPVLLQRFHRMRLQRLERLTRDRLGGTARR